MQSDIDIIEQYRDNKLTPEGLEQLRQSVNTLDDRALEQMLDKCGTSDSDTTISGQAEQRMHDVIFQEIGILPARHTSRWLRPLLWAAAIMIPALMAATAFLYIQNNDYRQMAETDIAVMTGEGERVTTVLPDGSKVELNYRSELRYAPASFNNTQRRVSFSGEAYFTVAHNPAAPFTVDASGLEVIVKGTMFNMRVRNDEEIASVYLDEGCVNLRTSQQNVMLSPGQLASVNRKTGHIDVTDPKDNIEQTAWRNGFLRFDNRPINKVIEALSSNYGYRIKIDADSADVKGRFTGYIPADNFNEAIGILEYAYHLNAHIDGRTVTLAK